MKGMLRQRICNLDFSHHVGYFLVGGQIIGEFWKFGECVNSRRGRLAAGACRSQQQARIRDPPSASPAAPAIRAWPLVIPAVKMPDIVAPETNFATSPKFLQCLAAPNQVQSCIHQPLIAVNAQPVSTPQLRHYDSLVALAYPIYDGDIIVSPLLQC